MGKAGLHIEDALVEDEDESLMEETASNVEVHSELARIRKLAEMEGEPK